MKRLTKRKYDGIVSKKEEESGIMCSAYCNHCSQGAGNCKNVKEMIEKLAEYEDLEEQGLLLRLPCKVGDTVFTLNKLTSKKTIIGELKADMFFIALCVMEKRFGKTVFLTQSEAEEALMKMKESED